MSTEIGDKAPHFKALDEQGNEISLDQLKGQKVILYFYPKDNTSGCTAEACDFRDNLSALNKAKAQVLGVSKDSAKSHQKFKDKYQLTFPLLVDEDESVCKAYDVIKEKSMYGKKYMGIERSTFLIDENGKIQKVWRKVKVPGHVEEVLAELK